MFIGPFNVIQQAIKRACLIHLKSVSNVKLFAMCDSIKSQNIDEAILQPEAMADSAPNAVLPFDVPELILGHPREEFAQMIEGKQ